MQKLNLMMIQIYFTIHFKKQAILQHIQILNKMTFKNRQSPMPIIFEIVDCDNFTFK